jgi:hypothetical protein
MNNIKTQIKLMNNNKINNKNLLFKKVYLNIKSVLIIKKGKIMIYLDNLIKKKMKTTQNCSSEFKKLHSTKTHNL